MNFGDEPDWSDDDEVVDIDASTKSALAEIRAVSDRMAGIPEDPAEIERRSGLMRAALADCIQSREGQVSDEETRRIFYRQLSLSQAYLQQQLAVDQVVSGIAIDYEVVRQVGGKTIFRINTGHFRHPILQSGDFFHLTTKRPQKDAGMRMTRWLETEAPILASGTVIKIKPVPDSESEFLVTVEMIPRKGFPPKGVLKKVSNGGILQRQLKITQDTLSGVNSDIRDEGKESRSDGYSGYRGYRGGYYSEYSSSYSSEPPKSGNVLGAFFRRRKLSTLCEPESMKTYNLNAIPAEVFDDKEQTAALEGCLHNDSPIFLIHGPSGTGKTTVARELVREWTHNKSNVLVVSHSNQGLDTLLRAIKEAKIEVMRGGNKIDNVHPDIAPNFIQAKIYPPKRKKFYKEDGSFDEKGYKAARGLYRRRLEAQAREVDYKLRQGGQCIGATLSSYCTDKVLNDDVLYSKKFDYVIIDEASRAYLHEILPILEDAKIKVILIGDHLQLGNIGLSRGDRKMLGDDVRRVPLMSTLKPVEQSDIDTFKNGPFQLAMEQLPVSSVMLRTNRRSGDEIVELVSEVGYDGKLIPGRRTHAKVKWYDTRERDPEKMPENHEKAIGTSFINTHEATLVARRVYEAVKAGTDPRKIGVTAPYAAQVALIQRKLQRFSYNDPELFEQIAFQVASVDAFQGDERDTMYASLVVSNMKGRIGFLEELRRLRVAFSRARNELNIFGNTESLIDNNPDAPSRAAFEKARGVIQKVGQIIKLPPTQHASRSGRRSGARASAGDA